MNIRVSVCWRVNKGLRPLEARGDVTAHTFTAAELKHLQFYSDSCCFLLLVEFKGTVLPKFKIKSLFLIIMLLIYLDCLVTSCQVCLLKEIMNHHSCHKHEVLINEYVHVSFCTLIFSISILF